MAGEKVVVVGASGYVGSRLIPFLLQKGFFIRAASRSLHTLKERPWAQDPRVELVVLDVFDRQGLLKGLSGCEAAFYLVHSMNPQHKNFSVADRQAAQNMVWAAQEAGLKRIIYLGGLGEETEALSKHLRSRAEVGRILHEGKVPVTMLRAAMIIGTASASFEILRQLVNRLPVMITPRWVWTQAQPIAIRNVVHYLTGCLELSQTAGEVYDIGGPDIVSYRDLMDMYAKEAGLFKRIVIPITLLTPRLSSYWIGFVTRVPSSLARPLAEGLRNRVVCREQRIRLLIPQELFSCRQAIRWSVQGPQGLPPVNSGYPPPEERYPGDPSWVRSSR